MQGAPFGARETQKPKSAVGFTAFLRILAGRERVDMDTPDYTKHDSDRSVK